MGAARLTIPAAILGSTFLVLLGACATPTPASTEQVESTPKATATETAIEPAAEEEPVAEVTADNVGFVVASEHAVPYATITNPTDDVVMATVNFAAYDAAGTVLGTSSGGYVLVRSGDAQQVTGWVDVPSGAVVDKVTGQVEVVDSEKESSATSLMTPGQVNIVADEYGWITVTGTIESTYVQSVTSPIVNAVCTDAAGTVVAAGFTYINGTVVPGTPAPFEMSVDGTVPTTCNVTATITPGSEAK